MFSWYSKLVGMQLFSSTVASRYYNCCTGASTSPAHGQKWSSSDTFSSIYLFNDEITSEIFIAAKGMIGDG
jgi:hypothetical protein